MSNYVPKPRWSKRQEAFVKANYETMTDEKISILIGRSRKSIRLKRQRLMLAKACGRGVCKAAKSKNNVEEIEAMIEKAKAFRPTAQELEELRRPEGWANPDDNLSVVEKVNRAAQEN